MSDVWRLFAAIELPRPVRDRIASMSSHLARAGWQAKWVNPEGSHLTLKFYGNVPTTEVSALRERLQSAVVGQPALTLRADGPGAFPNVRRPRVIWLGVNGDVDRLRHLQREIEHASVELGFPPEAREFHAHITVGRIRPEQVASITHIEQRFAELARRPAISMRVDQVTLFRSELRRSGAVYMVVDEFPLGGTGR